MTRNAISSLPPNPTMRQVAEEYGLSERTIRRYIAEGRIKAYRIGKRCIRIERDSLRALQTPVGGAA
jgi:excisionase family DNA binding protein